MNLKDSKSKKIIVAISIILLVIIFMATFIITQIGPYNKNNKEDIVIDIPSGSTLNQIADILKENSAKAIQKSLTHYRTAIRYMPDPFIAHNAFLFSCQRLPDQLFLYRDKLMA